MLRFILALAKSLTAMAIIGGVIFTAAGRVDLIFVWTILGILGLFYCVLNWIAEPNMLKERNSPGTGNIDRVTRPIGALLLLSHWVIAGLDVGRFHWSSVPWTCQLIGVIGYGVALLLNLWAMCVNRYYSSVVRIQTDRGHQVIDRGPYQYVRHPGYLATILAMTFGGVALGSWWALLPMIIFVLLFIRRASVEDAMLKAGLPGYLDYSQRVRWQLVPGLY